MPPNDRRAAVLDKALAWLEAGRHMVLVADPEQRRIMVYRSREDIRVLTAEAGDVVDGADVVPGRKLSPAGVFERG